MSSAFVNKVWGISTHAPTRGATINMTVFERAKTYFYSRPYARGDSNYPQNACCILRQIAEKTYNFRR